MKSTFRNYTVCLLFSGISILWGQNKAWESFYSYNNTSTAVVSDQTIITAAENALFLYDIAQDTTETITTVEGLSGDNFSALAIYNNYIIAGHENGTLTQIDRNSKKVTLDNSIARNSLITDDKKKINHIQVVGDLAYLSTGFGIVELNPNTLEFGNTYYFNPAGLYDGGVYHVIEFEKTIYAATQDGLYRTSRTNPERLNFATWDLVASGKWVTLWEKSEVLYGALQTDRNLYLFEISPTLEEKAQVIGQLKYSFTNDANIVLTFSHSIQVFDTRFNLNKVISTIDGVQFNTFRFGLNIDNIFWIGTFNNGLIRYSNADNISFVSPKGPLRNSIFDIETLPNELWIAHGDYNQIYNPFPLEKYGLSHHVDQEWDNISSADVFNAESLVRIVAHPTEIGTLYACSFHGGILALEDNVPIALWNQTNSGLESLTFDGDNISVRVRDALVDDSGNLWSITGFVQKGLKKRSPSGQWESIDLSEALLDYKQESGYSNLELYNDKTLFFGSKSSGLIGVDISQSPPQMKRIMGGDMGLPADDIRSIRLDKDNRLWVGTKDGLAILYAPNRFFEEDTQLRSIVVSDGGNLRELLSGQFISDIEVDGNNQKWISTSSSGVFLISSDGTEILEHFTKENSPLPTSSVKTIGIDKISGKVYLGTLNGMVAFQGNAYAESKSLSEANIFPNPVRPNYTGNVVLRGLKQDTRVKITDISGNLVYDTTSEGGSISWNLRSFSGQRVRSGVYLFFISSEDGLDSSVKKLMVIN